MNIRHLSFKISVVALFAAIMLVLSPHHGISADRIFNLYIRNLTEEPVSFAITLDGSHNWDHCYEGTPGMGEHWGPIAPGGVTRIEVARIQTRLCDGKQGRFGIEPWPNRGSERQGFHFDNAGHLALQNNPKTYLGSLSAKRPDGSYEYTYKRSYRHF